MKAIRPTRLYYKDITGAGKEIHGLMEEEFDCVEFRKLKGQQVIAIAPWIQFKPKEWSDMMHQVFTEMVDAWNEKHSIDDDKMEKLT